MLNYLEIKHLIKALGTNTFQFEKSIGTGSSTISKGIKRNSEIDLDIVEKIVSAYPNVNREWLKTGNGPMFLEDQQKIIQETTHREKRKIRLIGEAAAGGDMVINTENDIYAEEYIDVGDLLRDSEAAFTVYGNSMSPNYSSGCILGIKRNYDAFIQPGEIYLLQTKSNRVFKRLYESDDKESFTCYSDNTMKHESGPLVGKYYYPPFDIHKSEILGIYDITGMIKRTRNSAIIQRQK